MLQEHRGWSSRSWIDFNVIFQTKMYLTLIARISDEIDHVKMEFMQLSIEDLFDFLAAN